MNNQNECDNGTVNCHGNGEKHWCESWSEPKSEPINSIVKRSAQEESIKNLSEIEKYFNKMQARAIAAEKKIENLEYVIAYAKDIVDLWPTITMRTLWKITDKVASLKDALRQSL
jgi:hypothetical protein